MCMLFLSSFCSASNLLWSCLCFFNFLAFWPFPWQRHPFWKKNQHLIAQLNRAYDIPTRFHKVWPRHLREKWRTKLCGKWNNTNNNNNNKIWYDLKDHNMVPKQWLSICNIIIYLETKCWPKRRIFVFWRPFWIQNGRHSKSKWSPYGEACLTHCKYPFPLKSFHFWILNNLFLFLLFLYWRKQSKSKMSHKIRLGAIIRIRNGANTICLQNVVWGT